MDLIERRAFLGSLAALPLLSAGPAFADQPYPTQPIRIVSGFAAGGVTDSIARFLAESIRTKYGQQVTVENKPGASGSLATVDLTRARPDGYNLMVGGFGGQLIPPLIIANYPVDVARDIIHLAGIAEFMNVMTVSARIPVNSVGEFIAYAKANPGKLTFGSAGIGASNYLCAILFMQKTGIEMTHVPYKGGFGPTSDLLAGNIDVVFENVPIMMGQGKSDRLRQLAVTGRQRSPQFPDLPTMIEAGIPDYVITSWIGIYGPAGMPPELVKAASDVIVTAAMEPAVQERMRQIGFQPLGLRQPEFTSFFQTERARWKEVVDKAGIKL
jgi:tripartite-type tricarboxylate transporter receptor subunit TctC